MNLKGAQTSRWADLIVWGVAMVCTAAVVVPPVIFLRWREERLGVVGRPEARAEWQTFRAAMKEQSGRSGPVQRKVPRSEEPPELVWLRDYAALAVGAWVVFTGCMGGFLVLICRGVARGGPSGPPPTTPGSR